MFTYIFDGILDSLSTSLQSAVFSLLTYIMKSFLGNKLTPTLKTFKQFFNRVPNGSSVTVLKQAQDSFVLIGVVAAFLLFGVGLMISLIYIDNPNPTSIGIRFARFAISLTLISFSCSGALNGMINTASGANFGDIVWKQVKNTVSKSAQKQIDQDEEFEDSGEGTCSVFASSVKVWNKKTYDKENNRSFLDKVVSLFVKNPIDQMIPGYHLVKGLIEAIINFLLYLIVLWELIKLIIELLQRYVWFCTLYYMTPIGCAFFANPTSMNCFIAFFRMFFIEMLIVTITRLWISMAIFLICTNVVDLFHAFFIIAFIKVGSSLENWFKSLGWSTASTGGMLADAIRNDALTIAGAAIMGSRVAKGATHAVGNGIRAGAAASGSIGAYRFGSVLAGKDHSTSGAIKGINNSMFGKNGINADSAMRNLNNVIREGGGVVNNAGLQSMLSGMDKSGQKQLAAALTSSGGMLEGLQSRLNKDGLAITSIAGDGRGLTGTLSRIDNNGNVIDQAGTFTIGSHSANGLNTTVSGQELGFNVHGFDNNTLDNFQLQSGSLENPAGIGEVSMGTMAGINTANVYDALSSNTSPKLENATLDDVTAYRASDGGYDFIANTSIGDDGEREITSNSVNLGHQDSYGNFIPAGDAISPDSLNVADLGAAINSSEDSYYQLSENLSPDEIYAANAFMSKGDVNPMAAMEYISNSCYDEGLACNTESIKFNGTFATFEAFDTDGNTHEHTINLKDAPNVVAKSDGMFKGLARPEDMKRVKYDEKTKTIEYTRKDGTVGTFKNADGNLAESGQLYTGSSRGAYIFSGWKNSNTSGRKK